MKWGRAVSVCLPGDSRTRAVVALGAMLGVAVASLAGLWPARADSLPPASLAARVQAVEGANQIRDLLISYGHLFDVRDLEGYSQLFAPNGTWNGNFGGSYVTARGPAGVLAMMVRVLGTPHYDPEKVTGFHLMTNFLIHVQGDHATAWSRWTYFARGKHNELVPSLAGHYDDALVRVNGQWKFERREVFRDIPPEK